MSNNENANETAIPPSPQSARRASFAPGQRLTEFFGRSPTNNVPSGSPAYPGPISAAAANAHASQKRRMSISTLGLSGSPTQTSPFSGIRPRQDSSSSGDSSSPANESAIDETGDSAGPPSATPFGRRLSFGAKAMRDVRGGIGGSMNGDTGGFNWSDQMRTRAQRSSSIASPTGLGTSPQHQKSATVPAVDAQPPRQMPKTTQTPPDHFQERILKGDFYMD